MNLSQENIAHIIRIAGWAKTPKQVAHILGLDEAEFCKAVKDDKSEISIAYFKGLYSTEGRVLESLFNLAASGSSPAQTAALKYLHDTKSQLIKEGYPGFNQD